MCSLPIRRWACLIRRSPVEGAHRAAAVAGVLEAAVAQAALVAGAEVPEAQAVPAVVVEPAGPEAAVVAAGAPEAPVVAAVAPVVRGAERVVAAERRTRTSTIQRIVSRGPSFRLFQPR